VFQCASPASIREPNGRTRSKAIEAAARTSSQDVISAVSMTGAPRDHVPRAHPVKAVALMWRRRRGTGFTYLARSRVTNDRISRAKSGSALRHLEASATATKRRIRRIVGLSTSPHGRAPGHARAGRLEIRVHAGRAAILTTSHGAAASGDLCSTKRTVSSACRLGRMHEQRRLALILERYVE